MYMTVLVCEVDVLYGSQKVCEHQQFPRVSSAKTSSGVGLGKKIYTDAVI